MPRVLHVAHGEVVVEVVVEIERLLDVFGIVIGELDARLLPPEQVRHQADESRLREFMGMPAHGVVDAPDFHSGQQLSRCSSVEATNAGLLGGLAGSATRLGDQGGRAGDANFVLWEGCARPTYRARQRPANGSAGYSHRQLLANAAIAASRVAS